MAGATSVRGACWLRDLRRQRRMVRSTRASQPTEVIMKVKLPESARDRKRSFGGATVSTLLHAVVIGGSVAATGHVGDSVMRRDDPVEMIYVRPPDPEVRRAPEPEAPRPMEIPTNVEPLPSTELVRVDLGKVPDVLPPITSRIGTMSENEFRVSPRDTVPSVANGTRLSNEPFTELTVEKAVQARSGNPEPRYPAFLQSAGVQGTVYAQFVVDTTGRVEPSSIVFPRSDHVLFERAVRDVLLRSRYSPAEFGGQRVRQLVEQAFAFALRR
jgi:periplasmic protein TonB